MHPVAPHAEADQRSVTMMQSFGATQGKCGPFWRPGVFDHAVVFKVSVCFRGATVKPKAKKPHETWSIGAFPLSLEICEMEIVKKEKKKKPIHSQKEFLRLAEVVF